MESDTFRSRVVQLLQKSRRALRLYSTVGQPLPPNLERFQAELSAAQVDEWREANSSLLRKLSDAADFPTARRVVFSVFGIRNEFQTLWRSSEAELAESQKELMACAEQGDFIRAAVLGAKLTRLKARVQASQAAHHELTTLIKKSKVNPVGCGIEESEVQQTIELLDENVIEETAPAARQADVFDDNRLSVAGMGAGKIIPLRRR